MKYKHILFDLDRTLWDFQANSFQTFQEMFEHFELEKRCNVDFDGFYLKYKEINAVLWDMYRQGTLSKELLYVRRFSITLEYFGLKDTADLSRRLGDFYVLEGPKKTALLPGAKELLDSLKRKGYPLYIVSNGFKEVQNLKVKTSGIDMFFDKVFLSEDIGYQKPNRKIFDEVLGQLEAQPCDCVMIGDDFAVDIVGAKNAGIDQVYFNHNGVKASFEPTYEVQGLMQIDALL